MLVLLVLLSQSPAPPAPVKPFDCSAAEHRQFDFWLGDWDVAPRAHPGDGRLELVEATLSAGERLKARRRLPTGTHLPHPGIRIRRAESVQRDLPRGHAVWLDGERLGPAHALSIRVEPDALRVVV